MNRILIVGATGNVGGHVLAQLSKTGASVRAMVRDPNKARLPAGVEVVRGDLTMPETLDSCLHGIETVFLVWTAPPDTVAPALERIARHARRIVFLSAPLKTPHPLFQQPNALRSLGEQIEWTIEGSGLDWTFLRPGMFAGNALFWWAPQMRAGDVVRWPYLAAPTAPIDERDIAAVAVRTLCEDGHSEAEYVLTGPQPLSQLEQIETIADVLGRQVHVEEMPRAESSMPSLLLDAWAAALGQPAYVSSTFEELTGSPARTFHQWAVDYAPEFQSNTSVATTSTLSRSTPVPSSTA